MSTLNRILAAVFICSLLFNALGANAGAYIQNRGQMLDQHRQPNTDVHYLYYNSTLNVQLRRQGFSYDVWKKQKAPGLDIIGLQSGGRTVKNFHRIDIDFVDANPDALLVPSDVLPGYYNYYNEHTGADGVRNVYHYNSVTYKNVWPNIDIMFTTAEKGSKYNFILYPGANISSIRFSVKGAVGAGISNGNLLLPNSIAPLEDKVPYSYYTMSAGKEGRKAVHAGFVANADGSFGLSVNDEVPAGATLVIDPVPNLVWGSYFGGTEDELGYSIDGDFTGNIYSGGETQSGNNIATTGAFQGALVFGRDGYLSKFTSAGSLVWGTYMGGNADDIVRSIAVSKDGQHVHITGLTQSDNVFATPGAHKAQTQGSDAFIAKFDQAGNRIWSTYFGGTNWDEGQSVAVDSAGGIYCSGKTSSTTGIATPGAFQSTLGGGFLAKFAASGERVWGTHHNGVDDFWIAGLLRDSIYLCGTAHPSQNNIATPGAFHATTTGIDAFIVKFDTAGQKHWGTYLTGRGIEKLDKAYCDRDGNIYLLGRVGSSGVAALVSPGAHQAAYGGGIHDAFLTKFTPQGSKAFGTVYGGTADDYLYSVAVDANGDIYVSGKSQSATGITTPGTRQPNPPLQPGAMFLAKFSGSGVRKWGSWVGSNPTEAYSMYCDANNELYMTGTTRGLFEFTFTGAQTSMGGKTDAFIMKIKGCLPGFATASGNSPVNVGSAIHLSAGGGNAYAWTGPNSYTSGLKDPVIPNAAITDSGMYVVTVTDTNTCVDTASVLIKVIDKSAVASIDHNKVKIYPNPASDRLIIETGSDKPCSFRLSNYAGQVFLMHHGIISKQTLQLTGLPPGVYVYELIMDGNAAVTGNLLIQ